MSRRRRAVLLTVAALTTCLLHLPGGDAAALPVSDKPVAGGRSVAARPAPVQDPDRVSTTPAGWGWHTSVAPSTISSWLSSTGQRITDLEVTSASPLRFSAAYVGNSGTYNRAWWWYYGQTAAQVGQKLSTNGARLTDIEAYNTSDGIRYAVVMVKNTGDAAKAWGWYSSATLAQIGTYASNNNMRVIDSDRFVTGGNTRYTAIFVKNTGVDALSWWHYYGISAASVSARLNDNNARLINLERNTNGTFDVIMTKGGFSGSWWYLTGRTSTQVNDFVNQVGARIFHVDSRVVSGIRYYDVLMLDNTTTETRRIRNLVSSKMSGTWGFYSKRVNSSVVTGLNQDAVFEPASMIKTILAVHALRDVQAGGSTLSSAVTWYADPAAPARYPSDPDYLGKGEAYVCAYAPGGASSATADTTYSDPLGSVLLHQMLRHSDNRAADAVVNRYGFPALNTTTDAAGMASTELVHRDACGYTWTHTPTYGAYHNRSTLTDFGKLYEGVHRLQLLDSTRRTALYGYLAGGVIPSSGPLAAMIKAEASAAGLTITERNAFLARVKDETQAGMYNLCSDTGDCSKALVVRGVAGIITLPFKSARGTSDVGFVHGRFVNVQTTCSFSQVSAGTCSAASSATSGLDQISVEQLRAAVRSALATW